MAIEKEYKTKFGITLPNAYHRVTEFFFSADAKQVGMQVATYVDKAARDQHSDPIEVNPYTVYDNGIKKTNLSIDILTREEGTIVVTLGDIVYEFPVDNLLKALQNSPIAVDFAFTQTPDNGINITALDNGRFSGGKGTTVDVNGTGITSIYYIVPPQDYKSSDFETYFSDAEANKEGNNPRALCYKYLKVNQLAGGVDV